jgi:hypothetical protein
VERVERAEEEEEEAEEEEEEEEEAETLRVSKVPHLPQAQYKRISIRRSRMRRGAYSRAGCLHLGCERGSRTAGADAEPRIVNRDVGTPADDSSRMHYHPTQPDAAARVLNSIHRQNVVI